MRDVIVATLMADIVEGVPVGYATFVGYDEVAHHSGIREPDASPCWSSSTPSSRAWSARRASAAARTTWSCSPTTARPRARRSASATARRSRRSCEARSRGGEVDAPAAVDEAWGDLGALLADAREDDSAGGRLLKRATSDRVADGTVALGPNREALREHARVRRDATSTRRW